MAFDLGNILEEVKEELVEKATEVAQEKLGDSAAPIAGKLAGEAVDSVAERYGIHLEETPTDEDATQATEEPAQ